MFTGIVVETGTIMAAEAREGLVRLTIGAGEVRRGLTLGESLAVDGVCLTVAALDDRAFHVELGPETQRRTTLGRLRPGDPVHLEPALRFGDRVGGHLVTGHVDGVGQVVAREEEGPETLRLTVSAPASVAPYLVPRGAVTVDGVSLTVVEPVGETFAVSLVPHTLAVTKIGRLQQGDTVNLEADMMAKYLEHLLKHGRIDSQSPWSIPGPDGSGEAVRTTAEEDETHGTE